MHRLFALLLLISAVLPVQPALAQDRQPATVTSVPDGDLIRVQYPNGVGERVRLIGIDAPETISPSKPFGCYGPEAQQFTSNLLPVGTPVELELDAQQRDAQGRLLAYVWMGDTNANVEIVSQGYAVPMPIPPNLKHENEIANAANDARENGRGLWSACGDPGLPATTYEPTFDDDAIPPPVPPPCGAPPVPGAPAPSFAPGGMPPAPQPPGVPEVPGGAPPCPPDGAPPGGLPPAPLPPGAPPVPGGGPPCPPPGGPPPPPGAIPCDPSLQPSPGGPLPPVPAPPIPPKPSGG
jgi:endonuclease YncB( thermonuclease family)